MMSLFWSSLLWLSLLRQLAELSSIYDTGVYSKTLRSLHITITIVYIVILIFYIVNSAMRATTSFKPYNPMKIWAGWGHKHDRSVHRYF